MSTLPLKGLKVLDFSLFVAGPYTCMILGWLGAEVIKIESARQHRRPTPLTDTLNCAKKSCTIDLTRSEGVALVKRLVEVSDIVVEAFSPRTMKRFGLDYAALKQVKSDIIMVSMSAVGQTGPDHDYVGLAPGFCASTGSMHLTGFPEGMPMLPGTVAGNDLQSGLYSALVIMSAIHHRSRTGNGQYIDLSQAEVAGTFVAEAVLENTMTGRSPIRKGNSEIGIAPHGCYRCKGEDKWVSIAVSTDEEWRALCKATGHPEWELDPRYADAASRWGNADELGSLIQSWTINHSHYEVMGILQAAGVAAGPSLNPEELINDPHLNERQMFITTTRPGGSSRIMPGLPWRSDGISPAYSRAPLAGEHNDYVFGDLLGIPVHEVERLKEAKVIY